jgi:hypothetical protein
MNVSFFFLCSLIIHLSNFFAVIYLSWIFSIQSNAMKSKNIEDILSL